MNIHVCVGKKYFSFKKHIQISFELPSCCENKESSVKISKYVKKNIFIYNLYSCVLLAIFGIFQNLKRTVQLDTSLYVIRVLLSCSCFVKAVSTMQNIGYHDRSL